MSEQNIDHPADSSPESIAFRLMLLVADMENKTLHGNPSKDRTAADRQWILETYADCLRSVKTPDQRRG